MFIGFIGWMKSLSLVGKVLLGTATVGTVGAIAGSVPPTTTLPVTNEVSDTVNSVEEEISYKNENTTEKIDFEKVRVDDATLPRGEEKVTILGVQGEKTVTYKIGTKNGQEVSREKINETISRVPVSEVTSVGIYDAPADQPAQSDCDPNYSPCVPNVSYDLDCPDIGFSVTVIGRDRHRFDRDGDGWGCESY